MLDRGGYHVNGWFRVWQTFAFFHCRRGEKIALGTAREIRNADTALRGPMVFTVEDTSLVPGHEAEMDLANQFDLASQSLKEYVAAQQARTQNHELRELTEAELATFGYLDKYLGSADIEPQCLSYLRYSGV